MSENTVRLKIKVEDENSFKTIEINAKDLRDAIEQVKNETDKINSSLLNVNQFASAIDQAGTMVRGLQSVMRDLTDAYAVQSAAEARLEQVMRNTMGASAAEIQSIKDLASAQQQLGVVGDEVQLSGAQELATYISKKSSLEALMPVMNDMIAQQYGYNATAESAVAIASMMGKVLDGQTGALSRYGYTFTEAQEQILKFGTEEERAATLAAVVEQSVGGMNEALASTPYGRIVQANNAFGDLKETLGRIAAPAMTAVDKIAALTIALAGIAKGTAYAKHAAVTIKGLGTASTLAATRTAVLGIHAKITATAQNMLAAASIRAAAGTTALRIATTALYAAMTLGLSLAIQAVITLISALAGKAGDAADSLEGLKDAQDAMKQAYGQAKSEIDNEIAALRKLIEAGSDTSEAIASLNEKYGEVFGYHSTAADWYDTLTSKSEAYCRQLGYEAKAKSLSARIGALIVERDEKQKELDSTKKTTVRTHVNSKTGTTTTYEVESREHRKIRESVSELDSQIKTLTTEMQASYGEAAKAADQLSAKSGENAEAVSWQAMSYAELGKAIEEQKKKLGNLNEAESENAKNEKAVLRAMTLRYDTLGKALGLVAGNTAKAINKTKTLKNEVEKIKFPDVPALTPIKPVSIVETPDSLRKYDNQIFNLQRMRLDASKEQIPVIDAQIARVRALKDEFEGIKDEQRQVADMPAPDFGAAWGGIKSIGNSIRDITNALKEDNDAWTKITATIDGFIGIVQGIQAVIQVMQALSAATNAMAATKTAASAAVTAGNAAEATSNAAVAATGAASSVSSIPIVGPALAVAAVAAVLASLASLPKFANGGIVYGPTLGLMGEYGGASSNPEVIAPLSRLRSLIGSGSGVGEVRFRIEGRELVGISRKQNNIDRRTR